MKIKLSLISLFFLIWSSLARAEEIQSPTKSWVHFHPYAPQKNEYKFELGGMWEAENLYWLGFTYGRHVGRCIYAESQKCQQYIDVTGGAGGRNGTTNGLFLLGMRWQYVSFPKPYSPSFQVFAGVMNLRDESRDRSIGVYGAGIGFTTSLHEKLDVTWQNRIGGGEQFWAQSMLSISLKIDHWVDYFADRMKKFGEAAVDTTGAVIKSPSTFMDWFNSSGQNKGSQDSNPK